MMTEHQDDTAQAPDLMLGAHKDSDDTAAAPEKTNQVPPGLNDDTTAVPTTVVDRDLLAWGSADDDAEATHRSWPATWVAAAAVLGGAVLLAGGVWIATNGRHDASLHESALPVTVRPSVAAVTTTVTPAPVTAPEPPAESPADKDARFLALLAPQHISTWDRITGYAQGLCRSIAKGDTTRAGETARLLGYPDLTVDQATFLVNTAVAVYCPQYTGTGPAQAPPGPVPDEGAPTTTTTAPAPTFTAVQDQWFLDHLYPFWINRGGVGFDPALFVAKAHQYCTLMSQDKTRQADQVLAGMSPSDQTSFAATAIESYAPC
jgi:Protein of unknown function (DUF732)